MLWLLSIRGIGKMKAHTTIFDTITPDSSRNAHSAVEELNRWQSFTANLNLTHSLNERNSLRLDVDYLTFHNKNPSNYRNRLVYPERNLATEQLIDIGKDTPFSF